MTIPQPPPRYVDTSDADDDLDLLGVLQLSLLWVFVIASSIAGFIIHAAAGFAALALSSLIVATFFAATAKVSE